MANRMKRSMKTKVRATDSELMILHRIADTNGMKLAEVLRRSTLEREFSRFVSTAKEGKNCIMKQQIKAGASVQEAPVH